MPNPRGTNDQREKAKAGGLRYMVRNERYKPRRADLPAAVSRTAPMSRRNVTVLTPDENLELVNPGDGLRRAIQLGGEWLLLGIHPDHGTTHKGVNMRSLVIWLVVMASLAMGAKYAFARYEDGSSVRSARLRVERVFGGMKSGTGTGNDVQTAICMWAENKVLVDDRDSLARYSDMFDKWRQAKDLYRPIQRFEITSVERLDPEQQYPVVVTVTVDGGKPLEILVEAGGVLQWKKKGRG